LYYNLWEATSDIADALPLTPHVITFYQCRNNINDLWEENSGIATAIAVPCAKPPFLLLEDTMTYRMRKSITLCLVAAMVVLCGTMPLTPVSRAAEDDRFNLIVILADDLGWSDTTLYGNTSLYETPNIERLAARGMTFTNAYAAAPICSPTRASIVSGQNPARNGFTTPAGHVPEVRFDPIVNESGPPHQKSTNVRSSTRVDPALPTLGQLLKNADYATAHFGKWHLGLEPHSPLECGFDVDIPHWHGPGPKSSYLAPWGYENSEEGVPGDHIEDRMAEEAVAWLKQRDRTKPFYMNYWQFSVHAPFGAKPELIDRYRKKIDLTSPQRSPTYAAMVHSLDDAVGSLLDALEVEGIADETVIVFYSDNGGNIHCGLNETDASGEEYLTAITSNHPLRGGKGGIHEGGIRVPAVVVWPGVTEPGSRSDARIQSTDLYPTILRMLNVERPKDHVIDGVDFATALRDEEMDRGPMFTLVPSHGNTPEWLPPAMAVHHGDWKLVRIFHYGENGNHDYRLYNLRDDIGEQHNLAAAHPEVVESLDRLIEEYIVEAGVVVPVANPNFDPAKFDPSQIGVQAGGLKMPPPAKPSGPAREPVVTEQARTLLLPWTTRNCDASIQSDSLQIAGAGGQPFLANAQVRADGPVEIKLRIRIHTSGTGRIQWRTEDQATFPSTGQSTSFLVRGGDWQELSVPLTAQGRVIHVRLFPPVQEQPVEIDWIEIASTGAGDKESQRWDFQDAAEPNEPQTRQAVR
jgi:arylsulfatase A-like enzyme